jgi:hypothetical protein
MVTSVIYLSTKPDGYTAAETAETVQNLMICIEMFGFSIAHHIVFSYKPYISGIKLYNCVVLFGGNSPYCTLFAGRILFFFFPCLVIQAQVVKVLWYIMYTCSAQKVQVGKRQCVVC